MNNNLNLINQMGRNYNLTPEQFNHLTVKYQNDTRNIENITRLGGYYEIRCRDVYRNQN